MTVLIVDYGMGNLGSIRRSFEECGSRVMVSDDPGDIKHAERIVLPGVGAYAEATYRLKERGWTVSIRDAVHRLNLPLLGVCLGMQLLSDRGSEGGDSEGLGLIEGEVVKLDGRSKDEKIPHVGWNEVILVADSPLFSGIESGSDFYFVHSFHFVPGKGANVLSTTPYCGGFVSTLSSGRVFGVQFHPEKSSRCGRQLIRNYLAI